MRIRNAGWQHLAALATALLALAPPPPARGADGIDPLPGAPEFPQALRERLAAELAARSDEYVPRTRNLRADGSPRFSNRLLLEASPYLGQHAHNPVNWYPWGDEAFETAERLQRPVLVSIGYSTCHWCHVMEEETFDDPEVARYLNEHFIAIKVDREARPDVDAIYMAAIHSMRKRGGWPLNVWVTPDRKPFYAGTYFPPEDRGRRLGFRTVLRTLHERYVREPERIAAESEEIASVIKRDLEDVAATSSAIPDESVLAQASILFTSRIDTRWGGIGRVTKFPSTVPVRFLLRVGRRTGGAESRRLVELTLEKMAAGGIRDHIGGGFHRYSTEPRWLVPHFEKMLYDNALLAQAYLEAYQATRREEFAEIAREILAGNDRARRGLLLSDRCGQHRALGRGRGGLVLHMEAFRDRIRPRRRGRQSRERLFRCHRGGGHRRPQHPPRVALAGRSSRRARNHARCGAPDGRRRAGAALRCTITAAAPPARRKDPRRVERTHDFGVRPGGFHLWRPGLHAHRRPCRRVRSRRDARSTKPIQIRVGSAKRSRCRPSSTHTTWTRPEAGISRPPTTRSSSWRARSRTTTAPFPRATPWRR
jgi:hypothetical protein